METASNLAIAPVGRPRDRGLDRMRMAGLLGEIVKLLLATLFVVLGSTIAILLVDPPAWHWARVFGPGVAATVTLLASLAAASLERLLGNFLLMASPRFDVDVVRSDHLRRAAMASAPMALVIGALDGAIAVATSDSLGKGIASGLVTFGAWFLLTLAAGFAVRRWTEPAGSRMPLSRSARAEDHTITRWKHPFSFLAIVWHDAQEVSRRRQLLSRHRFEVDENSSRIAYEVRAGDLSLRVWRDGVLVAREWSLLADTNSLIAIVIVSVAMGALSPGGDGLRVTLERSLCGAGSPRACNYLGEAYDRGDGVGPDSAAASELFDRACAGGFLRGCHNLGWAYWSGRGVERDRKAALAHFQKACHGDYAGACNRLGLAYARGAGGLEPSLQKAAELYAKACDGESASGCDNLARAYRHGRGVALEPARAAELFRSTCERFLSSEDACGELAEMYSAGEGVEQDAAQSAHFHERACKEGRARSCAQLADASRDGAPVEQDLVKSLELLERACDGDNWFACFEAGDKYERGIGTKPDVATAATLYAKACDAGDALGCDSLAKLYSTGAGVEKNLAKAAELYEKVCESDDPNGYPVGCRNLGSACARGEGVAQDLVRAEALFGKACDGGLAYGCAALVELDRGRPDFERDVILGRWKSSGPDQGSYQIAKGPVAGFTIQRATDESQSTSATIRPDEITFQTSGPYHYRGRHNWYDRDTKAARWGRNDALVVRVLEVDRIYVRYLDSRYDGGWIWERTDAIK